MATQLSTWNSTQARAEITRLVVPGLLGFYTHLEITEVIATRDSDKATINVLTVIVLEERGSEDFKNEGFLNPERIKITALDGYTFGVVRYTRPVSDLIPALVSMESSGQWTLSGNALITGKLTSIPSQFVPPDSSTAVPMNRVLKNNFHNGSYVFEWADADKSAFKPLFEKPSFLQALSERVQQWAPFRLASLSDRIGSMVVQIPVMLLRSRFSKAAGSVVAHVAWHPKATARPIRATCDLQFDNAIWGYGSTDVTVPTTLLPVPAIHGTHQGVIWDGVNNVILAATGELHFLNTISININPVHSEPRVFTIQRAGQTDENVRINLIGSGPPVQIGSPIPDDIGGWTRKRMYDDELKRLMDELRFKRYLPEQGKKDETHLAALQDLRILMNKHGTEGVWLWDPYLSALDLLETLFHCHHFGVDLRGLTAAEEPDCQSLPSPTPGITRAQNFMARQRSILDATPSNFYGLGLEYRAKHGTAGWPFHDRFLIFPRKDSAALVWSLGTSINSLGHAHHILQRVDNGELVKEAFVQLWDQLQGLNYLIWRRP